MYFTDRGIEELEDRRGQRRVSLAWLAERLRDFVDENPELEAAVDRLASWLARLDDDDELLPERAARGGPRDVRRAAGGYPVRRDRTPA
jgi:hypothetical protein